MTTMSPRPERTVKDQDVLRQDEGLYGKIFVLSLVEFYEAIGGRSGRLAESLLTICDTVFTEQMGPDDGYTMIGEDQFVFRFGGCDDKQALARAAKIIEEVGTKILGDHFIKSGRFKALLTAVGLADVTDTEGNLDSDKISAAVDLARAVPPEPAAPDEPQWVRLNYAGLTEDDTWAAVSSARKDEVQWVALDYKPKKQAAQWETLQVEKDRKQDPSLQWQVLEHKKKPKDLVWRYLEVKKSTERRAVLMQYSGKNFQDRREGTERRLRPFVHLGERERRSGGERRRVADRRRVAGRRAG